MATLFQVLQIFDNNGDPLAGGKVYWYAAGTTTPKDTWIDQAESSAAANPVILDSEGHPDHGSGADAMWIRGSYKMILKDSSDNTLVTLDNVNEYAQRDWTGLTATIADLNSTTTTALTKTSAYTVVIGDRGKTILCDATSGAFDVDLPIAASVGNKFKIIIKKIDVSTNAVSIVPNGAEIIDAGNPWRLYDYTDFIEVHSDGSNWHIVAGEAKGSSKVETANVSVTYLDYDKLINCDGSGGAFAVTLGSAATLGRGFCLKIKKVDSSANAITITPDGAETIDGDASLIITTQYVCYSLKSDGANWRIYSEFGVSDINKAYPPGYLYNFALSNDAGDTDHDISCAIGNARDSGDTENLKLTSAMVKRIDASWVAGTTHGGFPTGLGILANTWYHFFIIGKTDGTIDAGFDSDLSATNLLADATGYTLYRRVGSVCTNPADTNIRPFKMLVSLADRTVLYKDPVLQYNTTNPGVVALTLVMSSPKGLNTNIILSAVMRQGGAAGGMCYISSIDVDDEQPSATVAPLATINIPATGGGVHHSIEKIEVMSGLVSEIRMRVDTSDANTVITLCTLGWRE